MLQLSASKEVRGGLPAMAPAGSGPKNVQPIQCRRNCPAWTEPLRCLTTFVDSMRCCQAVKDSAPSEAYTACAGYSGLLDFFLAVCFFGPAEAAISLAKVSSQARSPEILPGSYSPVLSLQLSLNARRTACLTAYAGLNEHLSTANKRWAFSE